MPSITETPFGICTDCNSTPLSLTEFMFGSVCVHCLIIADKLRGEREAIAQHYIKESDGDGDGDLYFSSTHEALLYYADQAFQDHLDEMGEEE